MYDNWCQQEVTYTNLMPTGVPNLVCGKRRNLIQVNSWQTQETHPLIEIKNGLPHTKEKLLFIKFPPWFLIGQFFLQMRNQNLHGLTGWILVFWLVIVESLVSIDAHDWTGQVSVYWLEDDTGTCLIKLTPMAAVYGFSLECRLYERLLSAMTAGP